MKTNMTMRMGTLGGMAAALSLMAAATMAHAGTAATSATAGSNGFGPGTAAATAEYNGGGPGFARTNTRSGNVSYGRGTAFGVDQNGVSFSLSQALAPRFGPAIASTFNISVGFDGRVNTSVGNSVARGSPVREASAGGFASSNRFTGGSAGATAGGRTGFGGRVDAQTHSKSSRTLFRR